MTKVYDPNWYPDGSIAEQLAEVIKEHEEKAEDHRELAQTSEDSSYHVLASETHLEAAEGCKDVLKELAQEEEEPGHGMGNVDNVLMENSGFQGTLHRSYQNGDYGSEIRKLKEKVTIPTEPNLSEEKKQEMIEAALFEIACFIEARDEHER